MPPASIVHPGATVLLLFHAFVVFVAIFRFFPFYPFEYLMNWVVFVISPCSEHI